MTEKVDTPERVKMFLVTEFARKEGKDFVREASSFSQRIKCVTC